MSLPNATTPLPRYVMRVKAGPTGRPVWAVQWYRERPDGTKQQTSRKVGAAWLERDNAGQWVKRKGRPAGDYLDARAAELRAPATIRDAEAEFAAEAERLDRPVSFREVATAFLDHRESVKGCRPSTMADYRSMFAEAGTPHKRGWARDKRGNVRRDRTGQPIRATSPGWIMRRLGDKPAREVTTRDVNLVLSDVAKSGGSARTVNKYRAVLSSMFGYAAHPATFGLDANPVGHADTRRQPPAADVEFYSREEVELLARTMAAGSHRAEVSRKLTDAEIAQRAREDARDAELVRVAAYTGLRRSEIVALRWQDVEFTAHALHVRATVSAGQEVDAPKSGKRRALPLTDDAAAALDRLSRRDRFTSRRDYVAVGATGGRLDAHALGKRVGKAQDAAGLRRLRLHGLRHTFASQLVAGGIGLADVQAAMGHSDVKTTSRYLHARPATEMADAFTRAQRAQSSIPDPTRNPTEATR